MSTHTFRITVRGFFQALTPAQRQELLAQADQHDILRATYTPDGHLTYDLTAREAFAFRFLAAGDKEQDIIDATKRAEATAATYLTAQGYGFKHLRSHAVDLALAPLSKRQRRIATGSPLTEVNGAGVDRPTPTAESRS